MADPTVVAAAITDYNWVAPTAVAFCGMIVSIVSAVLAYKASDKAGKADAKIEATGKSIDGRMDELLRLTKKEAAQEATLAEQGAQRGREAIADAATNKVLTDQQALKNANTDKEPVPVETRTEADAAKVTKSKDEEKK